MSFKISSPDSELYDLIAKQMQEMKELGLTPYRPEFPSTGFFVSDETAQLAYIAQVQEKEIKEQAGNVFRSVWNITEDELGLNLSINEDVVLPYDYSIDWGDGTKDEGLTGDAYHEYETKGIYTIDIRGDYRGIKCDDNRIISVESLCSSFESLEEAFQDCPELTSFTIGYPMPLVTNCSGAWRYCSKLTSFDTTHLTQVTSADDAWGECTLLTSFNSSGLTQVTDVSGSWAETALTSFDASPLTQVTMADNAWESCPLTSFDASSLTLVNTAVQAWYGTSLRSFDSRPLTSVTNVLSAWSECQQMTSFNQEGLRAVIDAGNAWANCILLRSFNPSSLTLATNLTEAWRGCTSLITFDSSPLTSATSIISTWSGCSRLASFNQQGLTSVTIGIAAWQNCVLLTSFNSTGMTNASLLASAWQGCSGLTFFNASGLVADAINCSNAWQDSGLDKKEVSTNFLFTNGGGTYGLTQTNGTYTDAFEGIEMKPGNPSLPYIPPP